MPLEFEENSPQKSGYTSAIPLPALESRTEAERQFAAAWSAKGYDRCLALLPQLPPDLSNATQDTLSIAVLSIGGRHLYALTLGGRSLVHLRRECLRLLAKSPTEEQLRRFKPLLFDGDSEIQEIAFTMYQKAGRDALPALLSMRVSLFSLNPRSKAVRSGVVHLIRLFKEIKDPHATET